MTDLLTALQPFHFLRPWWLLALLPLMALILAVRHRRHHSSAWQRVIHPSLLPLLVSGDAGCRRWPAGTLIVAAALASLAMAGPAWERTTVASSRLDNALVILFDLSPSMLATDIRPDRLTRARLKTIDILNRHSEGSVALVAWAGDAHVVTPLTEDANTLLALLPVLHPNIMPRAGSNPELALEKGLELLMNAGHTQGDLLFVTDGFVEQAVENLQQTLRSFPDFRLSILGVGSDEGAPIPLGDGGFARDSRGGIVVAQLGSTLLQRLASRNGGRYSTLVASDDDIDYLLQPIFDQAEASAQEQERTLETWQDRGPWIVLALLPLAVLAFRRNLLALLLVAPLLATPPAAQAEDGTSLWDRLWHNRDRLGYRALESHEPARAAELFVDPQWRAVADYRRGDFAAAAQGFAQDPSARGRFNLGNALARQGRLEDALDAYDQALQLNPDFEDARLNRELLEKLLESQQQEQNASGDEGESPPQDSNQREQDSPGSDGSDGQPSSADHSSPDGNTDTGQQQGATDSGGTDDNVSEGEGEGDNDLSPAEQSQVGSGSSDETAGSDEGPLPAPSTDAGGTASSPEAQPQPWMTDPTPAAEADSEGGESAHASAASGAGDAETQDSDPELDYWLRQVTDDPGGLLRRKFEYQSRQQALEPRQRFELPPDRFQEERW